MDNANGYLLAPGNDDTSQPEEYKRLPSFPAISYTVTPPIRSPPRATDSSAAVDEREAVPPEFRRLRGYPLLSR